MIIDRRAVLLMAAIPVLGSCRLGSGSEESLTFVESGHLRVGYPHHWADIGAGDAPWTKRFRGDEVTLQIAGMLSEDVGAQTGLARLDLSATMGLQGYTPTKTMDVEVEGAYDAVLRRYSYGDQTHTLEGVWIVASQWPYPATAAVSLSGKIVTDTLVNKILNNMEFLKKESGS